jgi:hypothetical protein
MFGATPPMIAFGASNPWIRGDPPPGLPTKWAWPRQKFAGSPQHRIPVQCASKVPMSSIRARLASIERSQCLQSAMEAYPDGAL